MEISRDIFEELVIFRNSCILGAFMMAIYDVLRIFRRIIPHGVVWVSLEDILYWIIFGMAVFVLLYRENDGALRAYIIGGTAAGILLYYLILGRWLVKWLSVRIYGVKKRLKKYTKAVTIWLHNRFKN